MKQGRERLRGGVLGDNSTTPKDERNPPDSPIAPGRFQGRMACCRPIRAKTTPIITLKDSHLGHLVWAKMGLGHEVRGAGL